MSGRTNQKGFSMIELLVALSILITGTLAVATMLMRSSDNSIFANQSRGSDTTALELVEAVKGEMAQTTFDELSSMQLQKLIAGSTTQYEYRDATSAQTGTVGTQGGTFVQRYGTGKGYIYKWRVEDRKTDYSLPQGTLKLEVTVGWNDKTYKIDAGDTQGCKYPCANTACGAYTGDPDTCARRSKITNWIIESKN